MSPAQPASSPLPHLEVVILRQAWETAWRHLLLEPNCWGVSRVRPQLQEQACELLIEDVTLQETLPRGGDRMPLADWCVWHCATTDGPGLSDVVRACRPLWGQRLLVLTLQRGIEPTCVAALVEDGKVQVVNRMRVVGSRMLVLAPEVAQPHSLFKDEREAVDAQQLRFSRTAGGLGSGVWDKTHNSTVTLVGCGRNGWQMAFGLVGLGVRDLRLIDGDLLQLENVDAMPGVTIADIGRPKVTVLAEHLKAYCPEVRIAYSTRSVLSSASRRLLGRRADLVVTCLDRDAPRVAVSHVCRDLLMCHLDIGTRIRVTDSGRRSLTADVRCLVPLAGCVSCVGGIQNADEVRYELAAPENVLRRGRPQAWDEERAGSLIHLNSVAIATGLQAWLDLLSGRIHTSHWYRLTWQPEQGWQTDAAAVGASDACLNCRRKDK